MAVGMGDEGPGDLVDPRKAGEWAGGKLRQLLIVTVGKVRAQFAQLLFDQVIVVDEPFGGRGDRLAGWDWGCPVSVDGLLAIGLVQNPINLAHGLSLRSSWRIPVA